MSGRPRHKSLWSAKRRKDLLNEIILWIVMLIFFVPALWIILTSVRIRTEIDAHPPIWIPTGFTLDSYKILFGMPTPEGAFGLGPLRHIS